MCRSRLEGGDEGHLSTALAENSPKHFKFTNSRQRNNNSLSECNDRVIASPKNNHTLNIKSTFREKRGKS